eukprot:7597114-Pyramimonas_sp.AAC.1
MLGKLTAAEQQLVNAQDAIELQHAVEVDLRQALEQKNKQLMELDGQNESVQAKLKDAAAREGEVVKVLAEKDRKLQAAVESQVKAEQTLHDLQSTLEDYRMKYARQFAQRKKLHNYVQELKGNIRVYCRTRPKLGREAVDSPMDVVTYPEEDRVRVTRAGTGDGAALVQEFEFDNVFTESSSQDGVYSEVEPLVESLVDGFNLCIFAYGQTGSGKTYTMEGPPEARGVNYRALASLFQLLEARGPEVDVRLEVSMLEIYNEMVRDLLKGKITDRTVPLEISHSKLASGEISVTVKDLVAQEVTSVDDVNKVRASPSLV